MKIQENINLIEQFYDAFAAKDVEAMIACYHKDLEFNDPVFGDLDYNEACAMWRMLLERDSDLEVSHKNAWNDNEYGGVDWEAKYTFSKTGRKIHNRIDAKFMFKDGLIVGHRDYFDLYAWCKMAFGPSGWFLGWTDYMQNKVRSQVAILLKKYMAN